MSAMSPQPPTTSNGENESIIQLLEHFKDDDGRVALLVKELQELSTRVQVAELATVDPRLTTGGRQGSGTDTGSGPFRRGGSPDGERLRGADAFADAVHRVKRSIYSPPKPARQRRASAGGSGDGAGGTSGRGQSAAGAGRVEEAQLPEPPLDPAVPLPLPPGGHEWEALQAAVNDSVAAFGAAAAKMGWKKWALTRAHSALLVSLFWWVVAAAFRSEHPFSRPIQDYAFGHFCRHYVTVVLHLRGKARDQYQQVWIEMMAAAALYLLAEVFPRSQHKFDDALRALVTKQLRLWTAGALPADMHPSAHADAHDAAPAAFSIAATAAALAGTAAGATSVPPTSHGSSGGGGGPPRMPALMRSPPAMAEAQLSSYSLSGKSTPRQRPSSMSRISPAGSTRNSERGTHGSLSVGAGHSYASGDEWGTDGRSGGGGGGHGGPQSFVFTKNSPVMVQMLIGASGGGAAAAAAAEGSGGGAAVAARPIIKGLMKHTVGGTLARMHRALDEPSDEELSYSRMAAAASVSAADAVASYEASRRAAAAEALAMRRGLVEARGAIEARQRAALAAGSGQLKQMSDRLSGYIQNDVDRLMAGKPTSSEPASNGDIPSYLRPTAGQRGGEAVGEGHAVKPARLMAPLYEMRRVEGNIRAALAGGRHSSTDTVARVAAVTAAREAAAAADWRPLAQWPVGTKDTRRRRLASHVLYGLDLEQYAL
ncbi:hypothetical protein PLESTB_000078700 [Pleodorina starrii]|uniref:Uncharacterized protein n=1 Tax=Pleodorina starrii TaxID=330485 RepID=A0A9W6BAL1_9CHLO|nr:hypothetical protein PLESTM_000075200 [Pleodorina starrii]GLC48280.1 hypothetical protein PLESTB_000078700 [Pleodorina starrii]GLC66566.1 hypothetical protein PLESTF_000444600 [Pleodorina starrii]